MKNISFLWVCLTLFCYQANAQYDYSSHSQLSQRLKTAVAKNKLANISSIGKSSGGKDIWMVSFSGSQPENNKAVLLVAGTDGKHPAGTEMAAKLIEKYSSADVSKLLANTTLYIIPNLNPDASEQLTSKLVYERSLNATPRDNDRDGLIGEDGFEDLNKDGLITQMRIEDPTGLFLVDSKDSRLLVKANATKGEVGKYLLLSEGIDNDKDGKFNEDGEGGVNIDNNFTFDYPIFTPESGEHQASEPETQAFLELLYKKFNIHTVIHFGLGNNLVEPTKYDRQKAAKRIISGLLEKDAAVSETVSKLYGKAGLGSAPALAQSSGNLTQTAYYHGGRFSYITPVWWTPKVPDSTQKGPKKGETSAEADFLKWADKEGISAFVPWSSVQHPDFPNQKVEVGGLKPYVLNNPPVRFLDSNLVQHQAFLESYINSMPEIQVVNTKVESLGDNLNRITVIVHNKGLLPTYAEIGDRVRFIYKVRTDLTLAKGQTIVSGKKTNYRNSLNAGESEQYTWLVNGKGKVTISAGCPTAGVSSVELTLP